MAKVTKKQISTKQNGDPGLTASAKTQFAERHAFSVQGFTPPAASLASPRHKPISCMGAERIQDMGALPRFQHDFRQLTIHPKRQPTIKAKLSIGEINDAYEQEADRVADRIMRTPEPQLQRACASGGASPRCQDVQQSFNHDRIQTKSVGASHTSQIVAPPIVNDVLTSPGQPLDAETRAFFEPRFGDDFSRVRVFTDFSAIRSAQQINARAYAAGWGIVFGEGEYAPNTFTGRALLAHELTHVAQQQECENAPSSVLFRSENNENTQPSRFEVLRLEQEMEKLAAKNAWSGVERTYKTIEDMGDEAFGLATNAAGVHFLGAQAARHLGDTRRYTSLLLRAKTAQQSSGGVLADSELQPVETALAEIKASYGTVRIAPRSEPKNEKKKTAMRGPDLIPAAMPFAPDQRASIEAARKEIADTGYFSGMIPAGEYTLDSESFTVIAGTEIPGILWGE